MTQNLIISIKGADRLGLVAAVTARIFDLGGNVGDASFAVLGTACEFSCVVEMPAEVSKAEVESNLAALPELQDTELSISDFQYAPDRDESGRITHRIQVNGSDKPGLVARITEVFVAHGANLVRMNSWRKADEDIYVTRFAVSIPPARSSACLAAVSNTAGELQLVCTWKEVG